MLQLNLIKLCIFIYYYCALHQIVIVLSTLFLSQSTEKQIIIHWTTNFNFFSVTEQKLYFSGAVFHAEFKYHTEIAV